MEDKIQNTGICSIITFTVAIYNHTEEGWNAQNRFFNLNQEIVTKDKIIDSISKDNYIRTFISIKECLRYIVCEELKNLYINDWLCSYKIGIIGGVIPKNSNYIEHKDDNYGTLFYSDKYIPSYVVMEFEDSKKDRIKLFNTIYNIHKTEDNYLKLKK